MSQLGKKYFEIGRGYQKKSPNYSCPYVIGVDIKEKEKPFVVASGDHHSDMGACVISVDELISGKWETHIMLSGCVNFVELLAAAVENGEPFPQQFILDIVNAKSD